MGKMSYGAILALVLLPPLQALFETKDDYVKQASEAMNRKDYEQAIMFYTNAISLDPEDLVVYAGRAAAYEKKREYAKALADCEKVLKLSAGAMGEDAEMNTAMAHASLAKLLGTCPQAKVRNGKKAVQHATKACELWDKLALASDKLVADTAKIVRPKILAVMAAAHAEAGDFEKAVQWQLKTVEAWDDDTRKESARKQLKLYKEHKPLRLD